MATVAIDALCIGMVLSAEVRAPDGRMLLRSGTELTARQMEILRTWGIAEVEVEGTPESPAQDVDEASYQYALREILSRFLHLDLRHPAVAMLLRLAALQRARRNRAQKAKSMENPLLAFGTKRSKRDTP
ncbi:hypothetical protein CCP3SC15_320014 [Gammaproteobacteria bacterium]